MPTINLQVAASSDDCRKRTGSAPLFSLTDIRNPAGYWSSVYLFHGCGVRFLNVTIPQGSPIGAAYLSLCAYENLSVTVVNTRIRGDDEDDAAQFSTEADFNARPRTDAAVNWDAIPAWTKDAWYTSPDIKSVVQEIVNRAGWSSGNDLALFWDDFDQRSTQAQNCARTGYTYDDDPTKAPKLVITYGVAWTQTISEVLGMSDMVGTKAAFKRSVSEALGMLDSVDRVKAARVTVTEILGMRDRVETRKHVSKIGDLPDHTITGGA